MRLTVNRVRGAALLIAMAAGSALCQNLGTTTSTAATAQLQNLQHSAIKMAEIGGGVGVGMTILGLALHARHGSSKRAKMEASNIDYKALSEEYARQLRELQARSLAQAPVVPAAGAPQAAKPGVQASTAVPASLPLQAEATSPASSSTANALH